MVEDQLMASPETLGLDSEKIAVLLTRVQREVDEGLLPAVQVALARNGKLAVFESYGEANDDSLFSIFSATKAITSAAAWLLIQGGQLDTAEIVADIIPEFASNGKNEVTVEQLFTHTAGFPSAPFAPLDWNDTQHRLKRYEQWELNWPPGSRFEYHPTSSMWVIADIIERRSSISFQRFVREQIAQPLGLLDLFVGLPESENFRVLPNIHIGEGLTDADYERLGIPKPPVTEVTEEAILNFNKPEIRAVGVPGGGGVMGAGELAMFYQGLLHGGAGGNIAGFPSAPFAPLDWNDTQHRLKRYEQWELNWPPGSRFEYHPTSSMWVIADIIERRSSISFQRFVREQIAQPLGLLDLFVGLPESENFRVLPNIHIGEGLTDADYERLGIPKPPVTEVTEEAILNFNKPEIRAVGVPGGGGVMGAGELAMFYQGLLHGGAGGNQIWEPETMASVRRVRSGELRDQLFGKLANRGLGIIIAGDDERNYRGFGKTNSTDTFGHNGAGGQLAWIQPKSLQTSFLNLRVTGKMR